MQLALNLLLMVALPQDCVPLCCLGALFTAAAAAAAAVDALRTGRALAVATATVAAAAAEAAIAAAATSQVYVLWTIAVSALCEQSRLLFLPYCRQTSTAALVPPTGDTL